MSGRSAMANRWAIFPFDLEILRELPDETLSFGAIIPLAVQVNSLMKGRLGGEGGFSSGVQMMGRLRVLVHHGYAKAIVVPPMHKGLGYQRTEAGTRYLNDNGKGPQ